MLQQRIIYSLPKYHPFHFECNVSLVKMLVRGLKKEYFNFDQKHYANELLFIFDL